jgi:hypothetical protein
MLKWRLQYRKLTGILLEWSTESIDDGGEFPVKNSDEPP